MKSRLYYLTSYLVPVLILIMLGTITIFSQEDYSNEILVYFTAGVERAPMGQPARVVSPEIQGVLNRFNISESAIFSAFPEFDPADTLHISPEGELIKLPNIGNIFRVHVPPATGREAVINALQNLPNVLFAEKNGTASPSVVPGDQYFSYQWSLQPGGGTGRIQAPEAWDIWKGSSSNIIAIIDGGIDATHPDLSGKVSGESGWGWDGHGIHVAGIAAAKTNNWDGSKYAGIAGVDWYAKLHSRRVDNKDDTGVYNAIVNAVNYSNYVRILNNSWRLVDNQGNPRYSTTVRMAFAYAYKKNRVSAVAMGNEYQSGNPINYPAAFGHGIIAVGATNSSDVKAAFSNTGNHIDVVAPGVSILSTFRNGIYFSDPNYEHQSGTSMATPHVSGIASLLKGLRPSLYNDDIERIIQLSADDKGDPGFDNWYGHGRVNAKNALEYLLYPYELNHLTSTGGTDQGGTSTYTLIIYGAPGMADAAYIVKRHEVRKNVNFGKTYQGIPNVWGRGVDNTSGTLGWSIESPNFSMGWTDVVPGTVTSSSATLRTYVYEVWTIAGQWVGWKPTTPSNVKFAYTVLGTPTLQVSISGPSAIYTSGNYTWTADASYGDGSYTYKWYRKIEHYKLDCTYETNWTQVGTSKSYSINVSDMEYDFRLRVDVQSGNQNASAQIKVYPMNNGNIVCPTSGDELLAMEMEAFALPTEFAIHENYPNPFNPSTTIRYEIPEASRVSLVVYDIMGREVLRLVDDVIEPGYHTAEWGGRNSSGNRVSSGIYIYRFTARPLSVESTAEGLHYVKKMLFTK